MLLVSLGEFGAFSLSRFIDPWYLVASLADLLSSSLPPISDPTQPAHSPLRNEMNVARP